MHMEVPEQENSRFVYMVAHEDFEKIKKDDTLIFDTENKELQDGSFYLFELDFKYKKVYLYGKYIKELNKIDYGMPDHLLSMIDDEIEILGKLVKYARSFDL